MSVPGVTVGRLGGDEFALLLELPSFEDSRRWVERYHDEVRRTPQQEGSTSFYVTLSVGLAEAPPDRTAVDELLHRADRALYEAKAAGRDRVSVLTAGPAGVL